MKTAPFKFEVMSELSSAKPRTPHGTRQAPECLDSVHISARSRELL